MKKKREQYSRTIKIYTAAHEIDPEACSQKALELVNADITGIVFSCAIQKGFASADIRNFETRPLRKGWREIKYLCGEKEYVSVCSLGPISTKQSLCIEDMRMMDYSISFEWVKN